MEQPLLRHQYDKDSKKKQEFRPMKGGGLVPIIIDDDDCTMVLVFPRVKQVGGAVDPASTVESPREEAAKIFITADNPLSMETMDRLAFITDKPMRMDEYQTDIRGRFLEILAMSGLEVTQFASIDGDETFVKIYLPKDGHVIQEMATKLDYEMPFKEETYQRVAEYRSYQGREPMTNRNGVKVRAFKDYKMEIHEFFEPFRFVDTVRILEFWLDEWVSLDQMEKQGVITSYFPCPKCSELEQMFEDMARPSKMLCLPDHSSEIYIRDYWGEEIAFFFRFMAFLCRSLTFPAAIGVVYWVLTTHHFDIVPPEYHGWMRSGLSVVISVWVAFIFQIWGTNTARVKQEWGASEVESHSQERPDWDYTVKHSCCSTLVNLLALLYVIVYIGAIAAVLDWQRNLATNPQHSHSMKSISAISLTVVIQGGSYAWGKIAPALASAENFRTEADYTRKLSGLLASVKIFVALWPFVMQCFVSDLMNVKCADSLEAVAAKIWPNQVLSQKEAQILQHPKISYVNHAGKTCVHGCHPVSLDMLAKPWAPTNCEEAVIPNLHTYFAFQVITEIAFIVIGIVLTKFAIWQEYQEYRARRKDSSESEGEQAGYSFLQWSAKLHKYELDSWGGSIINDYLEVAISYSIIVCFGIITPVMAAFALLGLVLSWRIRVYRMIYVTRRPLPRSSAGLGVWYDIFSWVNTFAVLCNIALVALFFYPGRDLHWGYQLLLFLVGEHAILLLRETVVILFPANPSDVAEIEYYNNYVMHSVHEETVRPSFQPSNLAHVDLSLNPGDVSGDQSSQDGFC